MAILKQYLALSCFIGHPLDLPRSAQFFKGILVFYYAVELFMQVNMVDDPLEAFSDVTIETLLTLAFVFFILSMDRSLAWYFQVAASLLASESVIACVTLPILAWNTVTESTVSYVILAMLLLWLLLVVSYIFKKVLNINHLASLIMGVFYFMVTYLGVFGINTLLAL